MKYLLALIIYCTPFVIFASSEKNDAVTPTYTLGGTPALFETIDSNGLRNGLCVERPEPKWFSLSNYRHGTKYGLCMQYYDICDQGHGWPSFIFYECDSVLQFLLGIDLALPRLVSTNQYSDLNISNSENRLHGSQLSFCQGLDSDTYTENWGIFEEEPINEVEYIGIRKCYYPNGKVTVNRDKDFLERYAPIYNDTLLVNKIDSITNSLIYHTEHTIAEIHRHPVELKQSFGNFQENINRLPRPKFNECDSFGTKFGYWVEATTVPENGVNLSYYVSGLKNGPQFFYTPDLLETDYPIPKWICNYRNGEIADFAICFDQGLPVFSIINIERNSSPNAEYKYQGLMHIYGFEDTTQAEGPVFFGESIVDWIAVGTWRYYPQSGPDYSDEHGFPTPDEDCLNNDR